MGWNTLQEEVMFEVGGMEFHGMKIRGKATNIKEVNVKKDACLVWSQKESPTLRDILPFLPPPHYKENPWYGYAWSF